MELKSIGLRSEDNIVPLKKVEKKLFKQLLSELNIALTFVKARTFYALSRSMVKEKI